jgi:hypothetical protein
LYSAQPLHKNVQIAAKSIGKNKFQWQPITKWEPRLATPQHTKMTTHFTKQRPWPMPPPQVKKWGKQEKQLLAKLIKKGKVDLSRKNNVEYIDQVRFKYYRERDDRNFRQNFCNYVREQEIEDTVSSTCRTEQGIR